MDEGLLNDLLECSVCLERLDTSSRVLPCQHTFCLKCLKVIVESHKELRCPECRVLVDTKIEELPPNVLLMRILEGMRSSAPRKPAVSGQRSARTVHHQILQQHLANQQQASRGGEGKPLPPHARALHDYRSKEMGDLSFKKGETIMLQKRLDPFWYQGECSGRTGIFPVNYVQIIVPLPVPTALCKALYDFRMSAPDEEGCLAFDKGTIITVHRRVDENWAEGRIEERVGIFPIAFVELNQAARQLMNSPTLNRPVPPLPDSARPAPAAADPRLHAQHAHRYQQMSMSTPATVQGTYQNVPTMSQSQPVYQPPILAQPQTFISQFVNQHRNIPEPQTKHMDVIHFINVHKGNTMGIQSVPRINDGFDRIRSVKYENYSTPVHKTESTYQNVRTQDFPVAVANFNANNSSDSSSPTGVSTTTPNSSNTSSESAEPSLPSSPDNVETRVETEQENQELNNSVGLLSLNESSTATNTSLNVSLPSESVQKSEDAERLESQAGTSKSGPESMLGLGVGIQAALSPSHVKEYARHRDKRHSLTPGTHLNSSQHSSQNRHSAEILSTSLLDNPSEARDVTRERDGNTPNSARERERRRGRSRSSEPPLPCAYIALHPYKPQKPDELQLRKGGTYVVTERCRDGWYKGRSERSKLCGVFPGNYVAPAPAAARPVYKQSLSSPSEVAPAAAAVVAAPAAPDAPPRAHSPTNAPQQPYSWSSGQSTQQGTPKTEKSKERSKAEKSSISSGVSLMKRLAAIKKCKSPPPASYSMDNPVFEDAPGTSLLLTMPNTQHTVHVRSGSCPSQLLRALPANVEARGSASHRVRLKERPTVLPAHAQRPSENPWQSQHRKSQSLDVTSARRDRDRHHTQTVKERFRCIVPYPPNSEYELELKVDDIVLVHRKRGDGWYKGTLQRTGRTGLFPASFVQSCPAE